MKVMTKKTPTKTPKKAKTKILTREDRLRIASLNAACLTVLAKQVRAHNNPSYIFENTNIIQEISEITGQLYEALIAQ